MSRELKRMTLTPRRRQVLELICKGLRSKEIADRLGISIKTVDHERQEIYQIIFKYQQGNRTIDLLLEAVKRRLVPCPCSHAEHDHA